MKNQYLSSKITDHPLARCFLTGLLLFLAGGAWISTAVLLARSVSVMNTNIQLVIGATAAVSLIVIIILIRKRIPRLIQVPQLSGRSALWTALFFGMLIRLIWVLVFRPEPISDGALYVILAKQIVAGDGLKTLNALAYWPPGYAFFLVPFIALFSVSVAVPLSQILLFAIAAIGVHRLARKLGSDRSATIALFLFAFWPNLIAICATPEKEMLVTACLVWATVALLSAKTSSMLQGGFFLGCAALVQPSTQLLILGSVFLILRLHKEKATIRFCLLFLLGATLAIAPWTVRNYFVFGEFKLISSNGGDVLYRANNSLATGGFTERAETDLSTLPELERDRVAKTLALSWIDTHRVRFVELLVEKQILFMGDDAYGIYATFRSNEKNRNAITYSILKLLSNAWWLLAWLLVASLISQGISLGPAAFLVWGWLYLFSLHSVFESSGRYHVPMLWSLCILLGILIARSGTISTSNMIIRITPEDAEANEPKILVPTV